MRPCGYNVRSDPGYWPWALLQPHSVPQRPGGLRGVSGPGKVVGVVSELWVKVWRLFEL